MSKNNLPSSIILFGSTGDLSKRKLLPSIYHLFLTGALDQQFNLLLIGRRELDEVAVRKLVEHAIRSHPKINEFSQIEEFLKHVKYVKVSLDNINDYLTLNETLKVLEEQNSTDGNRLFYLALPPSTFTTVTDNLHESGLTKTKGYKRLIIEKPFGKDLESAKDLSESLSKAFDESEIYRIDHYLGKEMVQNIEVIRFSNSLFEPLWNNLYISNIQITSSESLGVLERGGYYDDSGVVRDMFQNHMLQILSLLAMEPPATLNSDDIRQEKVKVLKSIRRHKQSEIKQHFVRGQYDEGMIDGVNVNAYRDEVNVNPESNTPTFISARMFIDNFRWAGVPFYVRTGKSMDKKETKIVVEFKEVPRILYYENNDQDKLAKNLLVIKIQPDESISLHLNVKDNSSLNDTKEISLSYTVTPNEAVRTVDGYENLIYDCLNGDSANFTHLDELIQAWEIVDPVNQVWEKDIAPFPNYRSGSSGPVKSALLLKRDGFTWWDV